MKRCVVNVATTKHYMFGQERLRAALGEHGAGASMQAITKLPADWPAHDDKPYAFKAYALLEAAKEFNILLWCDASIVPIRDMRPLWERIEQEGYWISRNRSRDGSWYTNYEWTADSAYPGLFPWEWTAGLELNYLRALNREVPHVVATAFGINLKHPLGISFLERYSHLAKRTRAFCGPWKNQNGSCGPKDVQGHRHDQTAASVVAFRLGMALTESPRFFADQVATEETILLADGDY